MSVYETIEARLGFRVPVQYREARTAGLFDTGGPNELVLTELVWMTPIEIAKYRVSYLPIEGLIPIARTPRGDLFCWYPASTDPEGVAVAFWPRNAGWATCYAPHFGGFLYRLLLEEFSASWLVDRFGEEGTAKRLRRYAQDVGPFLPGEWGENLRELSTRPLFAREKGVYGVLDRAGCDTLIELAFEWPRLNQEIRPATSQNREIVGDNRGPVGQQGAHTSFIVTMPRTQ